MGGLQGDSVHDERDEVDHVRLHLGLVQLVHQHYDDGQLRQHLQRLCAPRDDVVLEGKGSRMKKACLAPQKANNYRNL